MTHPATTDHPDGYACGFCRHEVKIHNLAQGCPVENCRCMATPGEANRAESLDHKAIPQDQVLASYRKDVPTAKEQALIDLGITDEQMKALSKVCLDHLRPPNYAGGSWTLNPDALANAIVQHGWRPTR